MLSVFFTSQRACGLSDNFLLRLTQDYYIANNKLPDTQFINNYEWNEEKLSKMKQMDVSNSFKNRRIKALLVRGIRKFGSHAKTDFYGVSLRSKSNNSSSLILLGNNGSGKTTLFAAMEKISKGQSNVAKIRGFDRNNDFRFLVHSNFDREDCKIKMLFQNDDFDEYNLNSVAHVSLPEACFCCDYDVEQLEKVENYNDFIHQQIGLDVLKKFKELISTYKRNLNQNQMNDATRLEEHEFQKRNTDANTLIDAIDLETHDIINELGPLIKEILENILNNYFFDNQKDLFKVEVTDDGTIDCFISIPTLNSSALIRKYPREYLNTFRFKLFVFSLKLALGICMKYFNNIDYPFVIDDMFDSSDFDNRKGIGEYFKRFIKLHDDELMKIINNLENNNLNLTEAQIELRKQRASYLKSFVKPQIVFLTQDELIAECLYNEMSTIEPVIWGRLFEPEQATYADKMNFKVKNKHPWNPLTWKYFQFTNLYDIIQNSESQ